MKKNSTERKEKRNVPFCPLLSIGSEILQSCIGQDCAWWVDYISDDLHTQYEGCALQVLPWVIRD